MTQEEFNALWDLSFIPACHEGMVLLKAWVDATPGAIDFAHEVPLHQLWVTPKSSKEDWRQFALHTTYCVFCSLIKKRPLARAA